MKNIAIKVNNKREFDALMKYYKSKGWETKYYDSDFELVAYQTCDRFSYKYAIRNEFKIIDFDTFAQIVSIEVVKEIIIQAGSSQVVVTKDGFACTGFLVIASLLEEIYTAYKSLQS